MVVFMDRKYYNELQKQNISSGKDKEMKDEKKYALSFKRFGLKSLEDNQSRC